jgi:hypothetical protein
MDIRKLTAAVLIVLAFPALALAQASREFNWIPSGKIEMGKPEVEARFQYWADSPEVRGESLPFAGGPAVSCQGRIAASERFVVPVATWRGGACGGSLVIRKVWDTGLPETTFKVSVDGQPLPEWTIRKDEGPRRWVQLFYVVPESVMAPKDENGNPRPKDRVTVSLSTETPTPSYGYAFFVTRDWEVLGGDYTGPLEADLAVDGWSSYATRYVSGIAALGRGDYAEAADDFQIVARAGDANVELARLARRMLRLAGYRALAVAQPNVEISEACFRLHYLLALYCSANGFWEEALDELTKAVTASPTNAEATYRLAEAIEHNRMSIEQWAPLMARAGDLWQRPDFNTVDVFVPIQTEAYEGRTGQFSLGSMEALYRDWKYVEQQVWGASRGTYKIRTHFKVYGAHDVKWLNSDWSFCPPEKEWGEWGTYDQSVITGEYGDSGACGPDCGFAGVGYGQIGPTRGWEVLLHEWNHQFDWTGISGETLPGYPVTHDSDGCGKQPIVNMGCGHRSSMFYYVTPAMYRRHETSDPILPGNHIKAWAIGGLTTFEVPQGLDAEALEKWVVDNGLYPRQQVDGWKGEWQREWDENQKLDESARRAVDPWATRLMWYVRNYRIMDVCGLDNEAKIATEPGTARFKPYESPAEFVDLLKVFPDAPEKCVAYAETYVWSPRDQEVRMWLGANDGARVWLNGRLINKARYYSIVNWDDQSLLDTVANSAHLQQGWNRFLVKVDRLGGGWGFSISLVTFDNKPVEGLKYQAAKPDAPIARYQRPEVGKRYNWDDVKDDYIELLPTLSDEDIRALTGLAKFETPRDAFFFEVEPVAGSRVLVQRDNNDRSLNNYLNWDWEGIAAVRYKKGNDYRDLIFIRPEYYEEYLRLLPNDAANNVVGTKYIDRMQSPSALLTIPWRYVIVVDGRIEGDYPLDEQDLLQKKTE